MWLGWTDEVTQTAKALWLDGISASEIARRIGAPTRNTVIGKVHRLGLAGPAGVARLAPAAPKSVEAQEPRPRKQHASRPSPPAAIAAPIVALAPVQHLPPEVVAGVDPRILARLERKMCRYPLDDPGPGRMEHALFCAAPLGEDEGRYCAHHRGVCFRPAGEKRERRRAGAIAAAPKGDPYELFPRRDAA
jgi:GcrA cell cycle regulator